MKPIKVLYIAGYARCGSTLVSRLLGSLPGFVAVGEAASHFFGPGRLGESPCGCGLSVEKCPFWSHSSFSRELGAFTDQLFQLRNFPFLESWRQKHENEIGKLLSSMTDLYQEIIKNTGAAVIVDSSKNPVHAMLLSWIPEIELSVMHLVRDPRGVVRSYLRPKGYLPAMRPSTVAAQWIGVTLACDSLRHHLPRYRTLRYEDFAAAPKVITEDIAVDVGYGGDASTVLPDATVCLEPQHMLGGNPDKLQRGITKIQASGSDLPLFSRILVSCMTAPLLLRHDYLGPGKYGDHSLQEVARDKNPSEVINRKDHLVALSDSETRL